MSHELTIRAWKDSAFRNTLSDEELAQLPANPAGESLTEAELDTVVGGTNCTHQNGHGAHYGRYGHGHGYGYGGGDDYSRNQYTDQSNYVANSFNYQVALSLYGGDANNYSSCNADTRNSANN
jgi:mersacidin/lichenicidin family type 2 lantibiotic